MKTSYTILIADKNKNVINHLTRVLQNEGHIIEKANDGFTVLTMLYNKAFPHLLIMEIELPYTNGIGILEYIRDKKISLPVIIYTYSTVFSHPLKKYVETVIKKEGNLTKIKNAVKATLIKWYEKG
jgi:CheY-like chemotaxis protein